MHPQRKINIPEIEPFVYSVHRALPMHCPCTVRTWSIGCIVRHVFQHIGCIGRHVRHKLRISDRHIGCIGHHTCHFICCTACTLSNACAEVSGCLTESADRGVGHRMLNNTKGVYCFKHALRGDRLSWVNHCWLHRSSSAVIGCIGLHRLHRP